MNLTRLIAYHKDRYLIEEKEQVISEDGEILSDFKCYLLIQHTKFPTVSDNKIIVNSPQHWISTGTLIHRGPTVNSDLLALVMQVIVKK